LAAAFLPRLLPSSIPLLRYVVPPPVADLGVNEVVAGKVGDLKPNSGAIFRFGSSPGLLILTSDGTYQALSATCTHLGCTVQYRGDLHQVWCPCHNGIYGIDGRNISGPPPKPLVQPMMSTCAAMRLSSPSNGRPDRDRRHPSLAG
jgi:nitrite reductase/ring-hydroxylating ferredoxin subunit